MIKCPITYADLDFTSSEQIYQFMKAEAHDCTGKARRILLAYDAFAAKKIGDSIEEKETWTEKREQIMIEIVRAKFQQNEDLRQQLIDTGKKTLQEATLDQYWGIGSGLRSKITRESAGKGENRMGHILMQIRTEFGAS